MAFLNGIALVIGWIFLIYLIPSFFVALYAGLLGYKKSGDAEFYYNTRLGYAVCVGFCNLWLWLFFGAIFLIMSFTEPLDGEMFPFKCIMAYNFDREFF
ncbi:MAG: hypothetical protein WC878_06205 [Candidatus Paceibacterota bacterium]